jgi:hypothetical protein
MCLLWETILAFFGVKNVHITSFNLRSIWNFFLLLISLNKGSDEIFFTLLLRIYLEQNLIQNFSIMLLNLFANFNNSNIIIVKILFF